MSGHPTATSEPRSEGQRLLFIDAFRGFSVLFMIEAHVSNSTILPELRRTAFFHYLDLFHGTISASFIFIAGFAFTLTMQKKWDDFLQFRKPLWIQIRRLLFILVLGYWLHLPYWSLSQLKNVNQKMQISLLRADVLMLIAVSLLLSLFLLLLIRNQKILIHVLLALALAIVFTTPFIYDFDPLGVWPVWAGQYLNNRNRSLFPFFPWAAYSFLGSYLCWVFLKFRKANREGTYMAWIALSGLFMVVAGFALFYVPWQFHSYVDVARASPRSFMLRLGFVFLWFSGVWYWIRVRNASRSILAELGQESLFIYGLHLLIVYGSVFTPHNFARDIGATLTYLPSFALTILLILIMSVVALAWHWLKRKHPVVAKWLFYGLCAIYLIVLVVR
jgi:uncharacterized membrane protein